MEEKRKHPRLGARVQVSISHASIPTVILTTRDFSETGLFLFAAGKPMPPLGTTVELRVQDLAGEALPQKATIVRIEPQGIGLRFCD